MDKRQVISPSYDCVRLSLSFNVYIIVVYDLCVCIINYLNTEGTENTVSMHSSEPGV